MTSKRYLMGSILQITWSLLVLPLFAQANTKPDNTGKFQNFTWAICSQRYGQATGAKDGVSPENPITSPIRSRLSPKNVFGSRRDETYQATFKTDGWTIKVIWLKEPASEDAADIIEISRGSEMPNATQIQAILDRCSDGMTWDKGKSPFGSEIYLRSDGASAVIKGSFLGIDNSLMSVRSKEVTNEELKWEADSIRKRQDKEKAPPL